MLHGNIRLLRLSAMISQYFMCTPFTAADACASGYLCQPIAMKANQAAFSAPTTQFSRSYPRSGGQPVLCDFMGAGDVLNGIEFRFEFQKRG